MKKNSDPSHIDRIKAAMADTPVFPIPKGEVWIGTDLLKKAGFDDTLENHLRMVEMLDQDMICLPITNNLAGRQTLGYRYFQPSELKQAVQSGTQFVAAVVDGPFQNLVNHIGLMELLMGWGQKRQEIINAYETEKKKSLDLIKRCLTRNIHAVIIMDDFAADQGPLINPVDIDMLCTPFYEQAVGNIHAAGGVALIHSCGKITGLTEMFKSWNLDGLAAVQHGANDLIGLHQSMGPNRVIMAGIDAELLESDPSLTDLSEFQRIINSFKTTGGLILSSACGLYNGRFLGPVNTLYHMADAVE